MQLVVNAKFKVPVGNVLVPRAKCLVSSCVSMCEGGSGFFYMQSAVPPDLIEDSINCMT